jgi:hypothetical protein
MLSDEQMGRLWPRQSDYWFDTETPFVTVPANLYVRDGMPPLADAIAHILGRLPLIGLDPAEGLAADELLATVGRHYGGGYPTADWTAFTQAVSDPRFVPVPPPDRGPMGCSRWRLGP